MFYAITSKRRGCGRSTLALLSAMNVFNKSKGSTLLVDLGSNNDFCSILNVKTKASIDNLISAISLQLGTLDLESNILHTGSFYLLPGTAIKQPRYLEKRCNDVVHVLKELETKFNNIILDVDYTLYGDLVDCGLEITPIHVLEQNMLNVEGYQKDIQTQIFEGYYVINRYEDGVFPPLDLFHKNFKRNSIICVKRDNSLKSSMNKKSLSIGSLKGSPMFSGVDQITDVILNNSNVIEKEFVSSNEKPVKGSFLSKLFGGKKNKGTSPSKKPQQPNRAASKSTKRVNQKGRPRKKGEN